MTAPPHGQGSSPWYRHFWPWFIVALLATSVTGGISTAIIAIVHADEVVGSDDIAAGTPRRSARTAAEAP